jgi:hypothetical protein
VRCRTATDQIGGEELPTTRASADILGARCKAKKRATILAAAVLPYQHAGNCYKPPGAAVLAPATIPLAPFCLFQPYADWGMRSRE